MLQPSLLDQGHKEWTGLFAHPNFPRFQGATIGVAADGGFGADHYNFLFRTRCRCRVGSGLDDANHLHMGSRLDLFERERGRRIAGDDEKVCAMVLQITNRSDRVMRNRGRGFRSVGEARGIAEVEIVGGGDVFDERAENSQAANAGIKEADRWSGSGPGRA